MTEPEADSTCLGTQRKVVQYNKTTPIWSWGSWSLAKYTSKFQLFQLKEIKHGHYQVVHHTARHQLPSFFCVSHLGLFYKQLTEAVDKGPSEIITAIILIDVLSTVLSTITPPCPLERREIPGKCNQGTHSR